MPRDAVIESPTFNALFSEPARHVRFDEEGIAADVVDGRRLSAYFVPMPAARRQGVRGRSNSTDDVACWFVATTYTKQRFFVRHAHFTGAGEPHVRLQKTLRTEFEVKAWVSLYATTSQPLPKSDTGRIAVKVIDHYGDEVLMVHEVE